MGKILEELSSDHGSLVIYLFTAVSTTLSLIIASVSSIIVFSLLQYMKPFFAGGQMNTILGGFLGSWLFILSLTVSHLFLYTEFLIISPLTGCKQFGESCVW